MKKIIVADDHKIFADLISKHLQSKGFEIVSKFYNGLDLLEYDGLETADFLILDLSMPGATGFKVIKKLTEKNIDIKIIILTTNSRSEDLLELHKLGIDGFVHKSKDLDTLIEAIDIISTGENYYSDINFRDIILSEEYEETNDLELTPREYEIAQHIIQKYSSAEIAEKLFISINTVNTHKKSLYKKLNVSSKNEFIKSAIQMGIISKSPYN